jgi:hypothetical protein
VEIGARIVVGTSSKLGSSAAGGAGFAIGADTMTGFDGGICGICASRNGRRGSDGDIGVGRKSSGAACEALGVK